MFVSGLIDRNNMTPLMLSIVDYNSNEFNNLVSKVNVNEKSCLITALNLAVELGNAEFVLQLLKYGARVDIGYNSLYIAFMKRNHNIFSILMLYVNNIVEGGTILTEICGKSDEIFIQIILDRVHDKVRYINMENINGDTPLMIAVKKGRYDIVKFLLAKGAKANYINYKGLNALDIAITMKRNERIRAILRRYMN